MSFYTNPSWTGVAGKKKLLELAREGLPFVQTALSKLGEVLPEAGSTACSTLSAILELADAAQVNKVGLQQLADQATSLMNLMLESQAELEKPGVSERIFEQFNVLLEEIKEYAKKYSGRNVLIRGVTSTGDENYYLDLLRRLQEFRSNAALAVASKEMASDAFPLPAECVVFGDVLSYEGATSVYRGTLRTRPDDPPVAVAVKAVHCSGAANDPLMRSMVAELRSAAQAANHCDGRVIKYHGIILPDSGPAKGCLCIIMDLHERGSLAGLVSGNQRVPRDKALALAADIADGLIQLHALKIIHRDLKPNNVLLDANGRAVISDFGLSRIMEATAFSTHACAGTPNYMAPEAFEGSGIGKPADVWALGAALLHLLTGQAPWHGENTMRISRLIDQGRPEIPADIEPETAAFLRECFCRNPYGRPTAEQCKQTLFAAGGGISSSTPSCKMQETDSKVVSDTQGADPMQVDQDCGPESSEKVKRLAEAVNSLIAYVDNGPQRIIQHQHLSLFWRCNFKGMNKVPWGDWWSRFPGGLLETSPDLGEVVRGMQAMLDKPGAKEAFQVAIERDDPTTVCVDEIRISFPKDSDLMATVASLVRKGAVARTGGAATLVLPVLDVNDDMLTEMTSDKGTIPMQPKVNMATPAAALFSMMMVQMLPSFVPNTASFAYTATDKIGFDLDTIGRKRKIEEIMEKVHIINNQTYERPINVAIWNMHLDVDWDVDSSSLLSSGLVRMGTGGGFRVVVFVGQGRLQNNGARGFDNWRCHGNQQQADNVITFDPAERQILRPSHVEFNIADLRSADGRFCFVMQDDGNIVLYKKGSEVLWASNTCRLENDRPSPFRLTMQADGNLVAYDRNSRAFWASNTNGRGVPPYAVKMQDDGDCVLYDGNWRALWATGTGKCGR